MSEKEKIEIHLVGGTTQFEKLNKYLPEKEYMIGKAFVWHHLLTQKENPKKWSKPTSKGTKVDWEAIKDQHTFDRAIAQLKGYCVEINVLYPEVGIIIDEKD